MNTTQQQSIRKITFDALPSSKHFLPVPNDYQDFQWSDVVFITPALSASFGLDKIDSWESRVNNIAVDLDGQLQICRKEDVITTFDIHSLRIVSFQGEDLVLIGKQSNSEVNQVKIVKINGKTTPQKVQLDWFNLTSLTLKTKGKCQDEINASIGLISFSIYIKDNK